MNSRQLARSWPFPRYKNFRRILQDASESWFKLRHFQTHPKMPYCLSKWSDWGNNIMLKEVEEYVKKVRAESEKQGKPFALHKYVHHGLSSQAMAFNLIGPQITRNDYSSLVKLMEQKNVPGASRIDHAFFEYEDREVFHEDVGQPTSIDIVFEDPAGKAIIFMESKLAEQEFGGCSVFSNGDCDGRTPVGRQDECYLHFIGRRYWELMTKYGFTEIVKRDRQCIFSAHYQFFREVLLSIEKDGTFVLLSDERSPVFHCKSDGQQRGIMPFLIECVPLQYRDRIVSISIQELVGLLRGNSTHADWVDDFGTKYGLAINAATGTPCRAVDEGQI